MNDNRDEVLVFSGPLFLPEKDPQDGKYYVKYQVLGDAAGVAVPTHFYKLIVTIRGQPHPHPHPSSSSSPNKPKKVIDVNPIAVTKTPITQEESGKKDLHAAGPPDQQRGPQSQGHRGPRQVAAAAFILPNKPINDNVPLMSFMVPPTTLEQASGLRFRTFLSSYTQTPDLSPLCTGSVCTLPAAGWWDKDKDKGKDNSKALAPVHSPPPPQSRPPSPSPSS